MKNQRNTTPLKEHNKFSVANPKEMNISDLPNKISK